MQTKDAIELIDFVAAVINGVDVSNEDKKIDLSDAQNFFPAFFLAPNAFSGLGNLQAEWAEIKSNDAALLEISNRFRSQLDLRNDVTEKDLEDFFGGLVQCIVSGSRLFKPVRTEEPEVQV